MEAQKQKQKMKMNNNPISSMTRLDAAIDLDPRAMALSADLAADGSELAQLVRLGAVLKSLEQLLAAGKAEETPQVCREAVAIAQELSNLYSQSLIGSLIQDAERRKTALREVRRGHALCGALLRRWRRTVALRRQALNMFGESGTYTPVLIPVPELK